MSVPINQYIVGVRGGLIVVLHPPLSMTPNEALAFAAWIVALAEPLASTAFADVLSEVQSI